MVAFLAFVQNLVCVLSFDRTEEDIKMKKREFIDLLTSVDVLNTIHGGTSEPQIDFHQDNLGRQIRLRIPGIEKESIRVEVHNNTLSIFYFIPVVSNSTLIQMPCLVYNKVIPYFIDTTKIHSHMEAQQVVVELPFNEAANGFHKMIPINED